MFRNLTVHFQKGPECYGVDAVPFVCGFGLFVENATINSQQNKTIFMPNAEHTHVMDKTGLGILLEHVETCVGYVV